MVPGSKNLEGTPRRFDKTLVYAAWAAFTVPLLLGFLAFTGVNPNGKSSQRLTEVSFVWAEDATGGKPMSHGAKVLADRGQSVTPPRILRATEGQQVINGGRHDEAAPTLRPDLTTCHPGHDVKQIAHVAVGCYPSDSQDASGAIDLKGRAGPMECARTCKEKGERETLTMHVVMLYSEAGIFIVLTFPFPPHPPSHDRRPTARTFPRPNTLHRSIARLAVGQYPFPQRGCLPSAAHAATVGWSWLHCFSADA